MRRTFLLTLPICLLIYFGGTANAQWQRLGFKSAESNTTISTGAIKTVVQSGVWVRSDTKETMTDLAAQKARCLPNCSFTAKSDDFGSTFEFKYYSSVERREIVYRGHVRWIWQGSSGPGSLSPGHKVTIRGVVSNLSSETSGVSAYANFGLWGFMNPEAGNPLRAPANGSTTMVGTFEVPNQPLRNRDGTLNPYLTLTLVLSGGNEQRFIERTIIYKWTNIQSSTESATNRITWSTQADSLRGKNGQRFTFVCPPNGTVSSRLWGSGLYTDDSSICTAAVHAGVINALSGGTVTIEIRAGSNSYSASTSNGVVSRSYGAYSGSFLVVGARTTPGHPEQQINWRTDATSLRGRNGQRFTFTCPAGNTSGRIWGTDVYTDDSSICTAAVHAGLIGLGGGTVTIEIRPGASSYQASRRNGVSTNGYGGWHGSFTFVR